MKLPFRHFQFAIFGQRRRVKKSRDPEGFVSGLGTSKIGRNPGKLFWKAFTPDIKYFYPFYSWPIVLAFSYCFSERLSFNWKNLNVIYLECFSSRIMENWSQFLVGKLFLGFLESRKWVNPLLQSTMERHPAWRCMMRMKAEHRDKIEYSNLQWLFSPAMDRSSYWLS